MSRSTDFPIRLQPKALIIARYPSAISLQIPFEPPRVAANRKCYASMLSLLLRKPTLRSERPILGSHFARSNGMAGDAVL